MLRNLGTVATQLHSCVCDNIALHDDVEAFGAPSECHGDVQRGWERQAVKLLADIEKMTGYTPQELYDELRSRVRGRWLYMNQLLLPVEIAIEHQRDADCKRLQQKHVNQSRLP